MSPLAQRIADNLARVRERIAAAEAHSGRPAGSVQLVAVTKYVGPFEAEALVAAGCLDLGESRPQELWRKAEALAGMPIRWHLIGHLQRNKVARTIPHISLLHSGDSERLLTEVDAAARVLGRKIPVLLEVNISGDQAKGGFQPSDLAPLAEKLARLSNLEIRGLMAMAALDGGRAAAQANFASLRKLRDELTAAFPPAISFTELSMGMSDDFDLAIGEGATIIRVGSALFEGLDS